MISHSLVHSLGAAAPSPRKATTMTVVRVLQVPLNASALDLEEHFKPFGQIERLRIVRQDEDAVAFIVFSAYPHTIFDHADYKRFAKARKFMKSNLQLEILDAQDDAAKSEIEKATAEITAPIENLRDANEGFHLDALQLGTYVDASSVFVSPLVHVVPISEVPHVLKDEQEYTPMSFVTEIYADMSSRSRTMCWYFKTRTAPQVDGVSSAVIPGQTEEFMAESWTSDLIEAPWFERDRDHHEMVWLTVRLKQPPKLFRSGMDVVEEHGLLEFSRKMQQLYRRVTSFPGPLQVLDFGQHLTLRCRICPSDLKHMRRFRQKLRSLFQAQLLLSPDGYQIPSKLSILTSLPDGSYVDLLQDSRPGLAFELRYVLLALTSQGVISKYALSPSFLQRLQAVEHQVALRALELMHQAQRQVYNVEGQLEMYCEQIDKLGLGKQDGLLKPLPDHCIWMRKVYVTPTRLVFNMPTVELGNRVVRQFGTHSERFLRISFTEEHLKKHYDLRSSTEIIQRILAFLQSGLQVADWHYKFLAFSSSQLRDHSCWFFAESEDCEVTCDSIRAWMGNFDHIKVVAKYASRLGQCFSSTTPVPLKGCIVEEVPDVERNGFCFSDGVGRMSMAVARSVANVMNLDFTPSAVQVRMAGYKGVLSLDPSLEQTSKIVQFRPSMRKFVTDTHETLGVIRVSTFAPAYLNHQLVALLTSKQLVDDDVFLKLQRTMVSALERMFREPQKALAMFTQYASESFGLQMVARLIRSGVDIHRDAFISNCVQLFQCHKLKEVKRKARVLIEDGVQLIGVLDETGTLESGELFVQYTAPDGSGLKVVGGTVLMTKMPAVHPGDIRVLECVDHPKLHHYVDVIVFPQKGDRPHTQEASGSDLDGDIYFVTWNQDLIPVFHNFRPLEYEAPPPMVAQDKVTMDDIAQFFVSYVQNDNLGLIGVAHKIHADISANGVLSQTCVQLAKLHSLAVDFAKTGVPAIYNELRYRVPQRPDFLGSRSGNVYQSQKALGKMYREVHMRSFRPDYNLDLDYVFLIDGLEAFVKEALLVKRNFDFDLARLLHQYHILSEFELVTQLIMTDTNNSRGEFEMRKRLNDIVTNMCKQYRSIFYSHVKTSEVHRKASAWYFVSYTQPMYENNPDFRRPFLSFPWLVVGDILVEILTLKKRGQFKSFSGDVQMIVVTSLRELEAHLSNVTQKRPIGSIDALMQDLAVWHGMDPNVVKKPAEQEEFGSIFPAVLSAFPKIPKSTPLVVDTDKIIPPKVIQLDESHEEF